MDDKLLIVDPTNKQQKSQSALMPTALVIILMTAFVYFVPFDKLLHNDSKNNITPTPTFPLIDQFPRDLAVIGEITENNVNNQSMKLSSLNGDFTISYGNYTSSCKNKTANKIGKLINKNESVEVFGQFDGHIINTCSDNRYRISKEFCGDSVCQEVVCTGLGCPQPETEENCPADCFKNSEKIHSIKELKQNIGKEQIYLVKGYVVKKYTCPPCPEGTQCKTCMKSHIVIMNNNENLVTYKPSAENLLIYYKDPESLSLGKKYIFTIQTSNSYTTGDIIPDIKLINFGLVDENINKSF